MKQLLLMRHAKSSWDNAYLADHERPLNARGKRDAPLMGLIIKEKDWIPHHVFSSDSKRTAETIEGLQDNLADLNFSLHPELYHASAESILEHIRLCSLETDRVMILAHNPGITNAVHLLTSERLENVPTAGLVMIEFEVDNWKDVTKGKLRAFIYPKMFI